MDTIIIKGSMKKIPNNEAGIDSFRGSSYHGVSKNGNKNWQILTMIDKYKLYIGTIQNILMAAIIYDIL